MGKRVKSVCTGPLHHFPVPPQRISPRGAGFEFPCFHDSRHVWENSGAVVQPLNPLFHSIGKADDSEMAPAYYSANVTGDGGKETEMLRLRGGISTPAQSLTPSKLPGGSDFGSCSR